MFRYRIVSFIGLFLLVGLAWAMSENRKKLNRNVILWRLSLQFIFALLVLKTAIGRTVFNGARAAVTAIINCSDKGAGVLL